MRSLFLALAIAGLVAMPGCKQPAQITKFDKAFLPYISAFTSGLVSSETTITVQLTAPVAGEDEVGKAPAQALLSLKPSVKGEAIWRDAATLEFRPASPLKPGQVYEATFSLGRVMQVPDSLANFTFQFKVLEQAVQLNVDGILSESLTDKKYKTIELTVLTADVADAEAIQKAFKVMYMGESPEVVWTHDASRRMHRLRIPGLIRQRKDTNLMVMWDGAPLGIKGSGKYEVPVPALEQFRVTATRLQQGADPILTIEFSDPLDPAQDLSGLVVLEGLPNIRIDRQANVLRVYPGSRIRGAYQLTVHNNILNIDRENLERPYTEQIVFEDLKPAIRLIGEGVIVPDAGGYVFPFEAVNLRSVDVTIIRIYASNVLQFLQSNDLNHRGDIQRVGRPVAVKTINLEPSTPNALHTWSSYGIKLDELIRTEPGAIYHIGLSFRRSYSLYECSEGTDAPAEDGPEVPYMAGGWDGPGYNHGGYWDWYDWDYDWRNRDNPCSNAYFKRNRFAGRNVIASNLGITAKVGNDGRVLCTVTDLLTTEPVNGVKVTIYNYQQQPIATLTTDARGIAVASTEQKPFMLMAEKGSNVGYLKMQDGRSLSTTRFETQGATPKDGLKGFLYGDRGVWRPGDSVYLSLMLEDREGRLPNGLPVQFTLINARGQVALKTTRTPSQPLFYDLRFATAPDDATGTWTAIVQVGGSEFRKSLAIETVKPNRLKVELSVPDDHIRKGKSESVATLASRWLHGGSAANFKYQVELLWKPVSTTFKQWHGYAFDDPASDFRHETEVVSEGNLDASGNATIHFDFDFSTPPPGRLQAQFRTRVYEPGGDFSIDRYTALCDPFEVFVGIKAPVGGRSYGTLVTDTNHRVQLVTVDQDGKPVGNRKLHVTLYKLKYNWWWNRQDGETMSSFLSRNAIATVEEQTVTTNARGEGHYTLRINQPNWGRYLIRVKDEEGHITGQMVFLDWPAWAGRPRTDQGEGASLISLTVDKERYNTGEMVKLTIPSSKGGRALVSLENGRTILRHFWVTTDEGQTTVEVATDATMAPNVYAHVTLLQPHGQTANDQPIRMYGIIPIIVENPATHLNPQVQTAASWRPNTTAEIKVSEANGRPMRYTIAVVDEGLLDLTRFRTPEPWKHFYAKEALGVRTWDMFDHVLGAFSGKLEQILSIGGDMEIGKPEGQESINRFVPMVRFIGPQKLERGKTATHTISIPEYVGSVRVMVVAMGDGQSYGHTEKAVPIKQPVMVLATMPRVLGPGERVQLPVSVFAMDKSVKKVDLKVEASGLLKLNSNQSTSLTFSKEGEQLASFMLDVGEAIGSGKVVITATSGNERASQTIEIAVRHPGTMETRVQTVRIDPGKQAVLDLEPIGMAGSNSGAIELSTLPPMNTGKRLEYLIHYPFGCIEQTTSSGFAQLMVREMFDLSPAQSSNIENNIKAAIRRLQQFQQPNGGLSYWPGHSNIDNWSSIYGGHFMLEAKKRGFQMPYAFLEKWTAHQKNLANAWMPGTGRDYGYDTYLIQAYRLYTLALAQQPELGAMNRLRSTEGLSDAAKWRLAAAYALAGQHDEGQRLARGLTWNFTPYYAQSGTYGSHVRDQAMVLEALILLKQRKQAMPLVEILAEAMTSDRWYSTQTTAYTLIALSQYARGADGVKPKARMKMGSQEQLVNSDKHIWQQELPLKDGAKLPVTITSQQDVPLYVQVRLTGLPPVGQETAASSSLSINVVYRSTDGSIVSPSRMDQGSDLIAEVTITNNTRNFLENLALVHIFPSGWEILTSRLDQMEISGPKAGVPDYQDIRDDRINSFFNLSRERSITFRYRVSATYQGRFYLPGVGVEAMYDNRIHARTKGQWVEVVQMGAATAGR